MPGLVPAVVLDKRSDASCPQDNGTVWSSDGYSWDILCNYDFPGNDLPAQPASSLTQCIDACNNYKQNEKYLSGASCVAVVYGAANLNGNPCYLKAKIDTVSFGNYMQYVAHRTQYNIGDAPIYTSIKPSASTASPPVQTSRSHPSVLSSAAIIDPSTAIGNTQPPLSAQNTAPLASETSNIPVASAGGSTGHGSLSSGSPTTTPIPPQALQSTLTQSFITVTQDGVTQTVTAPAPALVSATTDNTNTNILPASTSSTSSTTTNPLSATSSPTSSSSTLSDGAKIGIGVGIGVAAAIILSLLLYIFCTRRRRRQQQQQQQTIAQQNASPQSSELASSTKPTFLSRLLGSKQRQQIPSTSSTSTSSSSSNTNKPGGSEKPYLASEIPEMSSPQPAAAELDSAKKYHELGG